MRGQPIGGDPTNAAGHTDQAAPAATTWAPVRLYCANPKFGLNETLRRPKRQRERTRGAELRDRDLEQAGSPSGVGFRACDIGFDALLAGEDARSVIFHPNLADWHR